MAAFKNPRTLVIQEDGVVANTTTGQPLQCPIVGRTCSTNCTMLDQHQNAIKREKDWELDGTTTLFCRYRGNKSEMSTMVLGELVDPIKENSDG